MYKAVLNFRRIVSPLYDKIRHCYENSHCAKSYLIWQMISPLPGLWSMHTRLLTPALLDPAWHRIGRTAENSWIERNGSCKVYTLREEYRDGILERHFLSSFWAQGMNWSLHRLESLYALLPIVFLSTKCCSQIDRNKVWFSLKKSTSKDGEYHGAKDSSLLLNWSLRILSLIPMEMEAVCVWWCQLSYQWLASPILLFSAVDYWTSFVAHAAA